MRTHSDSSKKAPQNSSPPQVQSQFQSRPFGIQAQAEAQSTPETEKPDLQAAADRAKNFGHNIENISFAPRSTFAPEAIQPKLTRNSDTTTPNLETSIQQAQGSGQPLSDPVRRQMETAFGSNFSQVKIHTDPQSDMLNRSIQSRAFTTGQDVFFRRGEYNPNTRSGQELIAHELTHTLQQNRPSIQCQRIENPYAQNIAHEGWDTTAHHILPYSKLEEELKKLDPDKKSEILKYSVPDVLTPSMLEKMKVELEKSDEWKEMSKQLEGLPGEQKAQEKVKLLEQLRQDLRVRLVGNEPDTQEIANIKFGDIRESFFLWQGGNQFQGPNTTIRAEPSSDKDAIDFDGKYFTSLDSDKFKQLTDLGGNLGKVEDQDKILTNLKSILDITKNVTPDDFNSSKWQEINTLAALEALPKLPGLNRDHILKYSFFKIPQSEIVNHGEITPIGGGEYNYQNTKIPVQIKGSWLYISYNETKLDKYTPKTESKKILKDIIEEKKITYVAKDNCYEIAIDNMLTVSTDNKKKFFNISGYPDDNIPYMSKTNTTLQVNDKIVNSKQLKTTIPSGKSLYEYCKDKSITTSTYLPLELYEALTKKTSKKEEETGKTEEPELREGGLERLKKRDDKKTEIKEWKNRQKEIEEPELREGGLERLKKRDDKKTEIKEWKNQQNTEQEKLKN